MKEDRRRKWRNYGIVALALMIVLTGSYKYVESYVTVSSNVNGRELPIYSVETDEKKVALSFDAAWAACRFRKIEKYIFFSV